MFAADHRNCRLNLNIAAYAIPKQQLSNLIQLIKDDTKPRVGIIRCQNYLKDVISVAIELVLKMDMVYHQKKMNV